MPSNTNLHYGQQSIKWWEGMLVVAEGQLGHHPIPQSGNPTQRAVSRIGSYSGASA